MQQLEVIQQRGAFKNWLELSEPHGPTVFWAADSLPAKWFQDYERHSTSLGARENLDQTQSLLLNDALCTHMTSTQRNGSVFVVILC